MCQRFFRTENVAVAGLRAGDLDEGTRTGRPVADSPGEHTVIFAMMGETLEVSHRALNRDGFARGALDAAKFLAGKPPGLYSMADVLGLADI